MPAVQAISHRLPALRNAKADAGYISRSSYTALEPPIYLGLLLAQIIGASPIFLRDILKGTTVG